MPEPTGTPVADVRDRGPSEERRASVRYRSSRQTGLRTASPPCDAVWSARIRDVSSLGIGLLLPHDLDIGALLEVQLSEATGGVAHDVLARVVHVEAEADDWLVGCAFVSELDDTSLRDLHARRVRTSAGDSRRWLRFPCNVETACSTSTMTEGEKSPARILNASPGGVGLLVPCEFDAATLLDLDLPGGLAARRKVRVRVVRVLPHGSGSWFLGCEFVDRLDAAELRACL